MKTFWKFNYFRLAAYFYANNSDVISMEFPILQARIEITLQLFHNDFYPNDETSCECRSCFDQPVLPHTQGN